MDQGTATSRATEASALGSDQLDAAPGSPSAGSDPSRGVLGRNAPRWWPLAAVLVVQAVFSLRLVGANTAFLDEAAYLWAGHLQWAHWLHGKSVPPFSSYFSGSPVIYPPLAALVDSVGGLTAARILSLVFMLGATTLLWSTVGRLFNLRAAFFASALFAVLGPTLHLGAFATYDAMSLFLVALATWVVVRADDQGDATGRMVTAGVVLALANAVAYASALFDPIVVLIALLTALPRPGGKTALRRIAILLIVLVTLLLAGLLIGGSSYLHGIDMTTLTRAPGAASPLTVLENSWAWAGLITILAAGGVVTSRVGRQEPARTWLLAVVTIAAILGPLEQARLHTAASLDKHVGLGAWFAAIAAGYAVDRFVEAAHGASTHGASTHGASTDEARKTRNFTLAACVLALAFPLSLGASQSWTFSTDWPNSASFVGILRPLVSHGSGHLLIEDPSIPEYYLPTGSRWQRWSSTRNIVLPSGQSTGGPSKAAGVVGPGNAGTFAAYIEEGYFSIVALNYQDTTALDYQITADLGRNPNYHKIQVVPYGVEIPPIGKGTYVIWQYKKKS
jgi:Dolichyl-phosphate-mannose-protein mannosyltransferase